MARPRSPRPPPQGDPTPAPTVIRWRKLLGKGERDVDVSPVSVVRAVVGSEIPRYFTDLGPPHDPLVDDPGDPCRLEVAHYGAAYLVGKVRVQGVAAAGDVPHV